MTGIFTLHLGHEQIHITLMQLTALQKMKKKDIAFSILEKLCFSLNTGNTILSVYFQRQVRFLNSK